MKPRKVTNFKNKLVLVTGASSGIGAAAAKEFAHCGAQIILLARRENKLREIADQIKATGGQAYDYPCDLTQPETVQTITNKIKTDIGIPDIIINCAGSGRWLFTQETTPQQAIQMMAMPYFAAFFITRAFIEEMLQRRSGHIVNVTSINAIAAFSGSTAYTAARWAMRGFHEALNADFYQTGLKASLAYFAKVNSTYWEHNPGSEERLPKAHKLIPPITPEQAARAIVKGVYRGKKEVTTPWLMNFFMFLNRFFPGIMRFLGDKTGYR